MIRGCDSGVYFATQCLKQNSRRVALQVQRLGAIYL